VVVVLVAHGTKHGHIATRDPLANGPGSSFSSGVDWNPGRNCEWLRNRGFLDARQNPLYPYKIRSELEVQEW